MKNTVINLFREGRVEARERIRSDENNEGDYWISLLHKFIYSVAKQLAVTNSKRVKH